MSEHFTHPTPDAPLGKFEHPDVTSKGEERAFVHLHELSTLWVNTGTLCNIECGHCYIESSPSNDQLSYITCNEVASYLDEISNLGWNTKEIGLTGGEPFMNPECCAIIEEALTRGFNVLVLTNAMQPLLRPRIKSALLALRNTFASELSLRISIDHYTEDLHDKERGLGSWDKTMEGLRWLTDNNFTLDIAGRTCWGEDEATTRAGYKALFSRLGTALDADDPAALVLFPEMDEAAEVPEITTACWNILGKRPEDVMCASSRMIVKRKGETKPSVVACTLLPYDRQFDLGPRLAHAQGPVKLNHPHCAKFCVLGGGVCSVD